MATAERAYQLTLALAREAHEQQEIDDTYRDLVSLYASTGAWAQGEAAYAAYAAYAALQASSNDSVKTSLFAFIDVARFRWGQGQDPAPLLAEGLRHARERRFLIAR